MHDEEDMYGVESWGLADPPSGTSQPVGLPPQKVAKMQLASGLPDAAWNTLEAAGWSPAKAAKFLQYDPRLCGGGRGITGKGLFMSLEDLSKDLR
jgi:hypothetical protein